MRSPVAVAVAAIVQLTILPLVAAVLSLVSDRIGRWTRWVAPMGCAAAVFLGVRAMLYSGSYLRIRPTQPLFGSPAPSAFVVFIFDWSSVLIIGLCALSVCICFARGAGTPRRDAWLLTAMSATCGMAVAGSPPVIAMLLVMMALPFFGLLSGGLGPPPPGVVRDTWAHTRWELKAALRSRWFALVGIGCSWWVMEALGRPFVLAGRDPAGLVDLAGFPGGSLAHTTDSVAGLTVALAALCGVWPLGVLLSGQWTALGARAGAAALVVGPAAVGLSLWFRVFVNSHEAMIGGFPLSGRRDLLLGLAAMGIVSGIIAMASARDRDRLRQVACVSQVSYLVAGLVLASAGVSRALYAYPALALNLALSGGGLVLADRLERTELRGLLRGVCYSSLMGCPPFGGFLGRFILLGAVAEKLGSRWSWVALLLWAGEVGAVAFAGWRVRRTRTDTSVEGGASGGAWARASETAWSAGLLALHLCAAPLALLVGDLLARQIVSGQV